MPIRSCRSFAVCLFVAFAIASCGSEIASPDGASNGNLDTTSFAILAAITDTLYYGEHAWVAARNAGKDPSVLRLFIHSTPAAIDSITDDTIHFTVPNNTSNGRIRLYKHDSIEAKNYATLHVLPHHIEFQSKVWEYYPPAAYSGEKLTLLITDFPFRRREFDLFLNNVKLEVLAWDSTKIEALIPQDATSGELIVKTFNKPIFQVQYEILEHNGKLFTEGALTHLRIGANTLNADNVRMIGDSVNSRTPVQFTENTLLVLTTPITFSGSDTVRGSGTLASPFLRRYIDIQLIQNTERNIVSGSIATKEETLADDVVTNTDSCFVEIQNMPWRLANGKYIISQVGQEVDMNLVSYRKMLFNRFGQMDMLEYTGAQANSKISIEVYK